ncbi:MAG: hypothetical protein R8P61_17990 [Bacteroidia bacterium]|nr:hypothetical protein [Bacteroidia bacterium]
MEKFKHLHLWMILPLLIIQLGIFNYYWPGFSSKSWEIHIHYWLVSAWYLFLILQAHFLTKNKLSKHRTWGIFGFLLAGGVIFSAISLLDFPLKLAAQANPEAGGPPVFFYYATLIAEFFSIIAFAYAISQAIIHRKNLQEHAWWLIASVFYMMVPALGRGMILFWRTILNPEDFSPLYVFTSTELIYLFLFLFFAYKFGKLKHPASWIGLGLIAIRFISKPLAANESVQDFLQSLIKY